jgi:hypothetical protein
LEIKKLNYGERIWEKKIGIGIRRKERKLIIFWIEKWRNFWNKRLKRIKRTKKEYLINII